MSTCGSSEIHRHPRKKSDDKTQKQLTEHDSKRPARKQKTVARLVDSHDELESIPEETPNSSLPPSPQLTNQVLMLEKSMLEHKSEMDKNSHCLELLLDEDPSKNKRNGDLTKLASDTRLALKQLEELKQEMGQILQRCSKHEEIIKTLGEKLDACLANHPRDTSRSREGQVTAGHAEDSAGRTTYRRQYSYSEMLRANSNQPEGRVTLRNNTSRRSDAYRRNNQGQPRNASTGGARRKVIVLHDGTHDDFNPSLFASRYDIKTVRCPSLESVKASDSVIQEIEAATPSLILIHLGTKDIYDGRPLNEIQAEMKSLSLRLTQISHTCISLPIVPRASGLNGFIDKLTEFNDSTAKMITAWKKTPPRGMTKKIFTCTKPMMSPMVKVNVEQPHIAVTSSTGKAKLWLKLRDALDRMSGLLPPRAQTQQRQNGPHAQTEASGTAISVLTSQNSQAVPAPGAGPPVAPVLPSTSNQPNTNQKDENDNGSSTQL